MFQDNRMFLAYLSGVISGAILVMLLTLGPPRHAHASDNDDTVEALREIARVIDRKECK